MLRGLLVSVALVFAPVAATAQDRDATLADIRQDLTVLYTEIQNLKRELSTTGAPSVNAGSGGASQRMDTLEAEVARLTAKTEELDNRINRVVQDGTNRIGDLEFRLVELEGGDISQLGETTTLGGGALPVAPATPVPTPQPDGPQLAVGEEDDFRRAQEAYDAGDYQLAVERFQLFTDTYLGGPLTGIAHYLRGESLKNLGLDTQSARAYLESFSGSPEGEVAPAALLQLGLSLNRIGQPSEACVTLGEVTARFPTSPASIEAQTARVNLGCT